MNNLVIDVETHCKALLIRMLARLATTLTVVDGGVYYQDGSYSQVHLTTTKTADEVEDWMYHSKAEICYVGVVYA